jgi:hypothetical protein
LLLSPIVCGQKRTGGGVKLLACFAPESIVPLQKGFYWEGAELKHDPLEDWYRFWEPLKRCLWPPEEGRRLESQDYGNELDHERETLTLEGISYKDSINAVAKLWSESKEELENEIQR